MQLARPRTQSETELDPKWTMQLARPRTQSETELDPEWTMRLARSRTQFETELVSVSKDRARPRVDHAVISTFKDTV